MRNLGFIGLGAIGAPMAKTLLLAGFHLSAFDVLSERVRVLEAQGARATDSPREASEGADAVILMVMNATQAEEALFGKNGAVKALSPGAVVVIMCTIGPEKTRELANRLGGLGLRVVDAPVTGGTARAEQGDLVVLAGGDKELLEDVRPALGTLGSNIVHCGERAGDGQAVKMVNQHLAGIHLAAAGEAIAFAEALGLDSRFVLETVKQGAASSFMLENRGESMLVGDFASGGSKLDILIKDIGLVIEAAQETDFRTPLAASAHEIYQRASELGLADEEDAGIVRMFKCYQSRLPR